MQLPFYFAFSQNLPMRLKMLIFKLPNNKSGHLTIKQMTKKNLLELVSHYSKVAEYKINIQKPMTFIAAMNKWNLI